MQTISQQRKLSGIDVCLLLINLILVVAFNLSFYVWFVSSDPQWVSAIWCLAGLLVIWMLCWTTQTGTTQLTLVTLYSLLNGLSYLWLPEVEAYITVFLQSVVTLIVGMTVSLSLVEQFQAGSQINLPVVVVSYLILVVTLMLNLTGVWLMLTGGV